MYIDLEELIQSRHHHDSGSSRGKAVLPFISVLGGFEIAHGGGVLQRLSFLPIYLSQFLYNLSGNFQSLKNKLKFKMVSLSFFLEE